MLDRCRLQSTLTVNSLGMARSRNHYRLGIESRNDESGLGEYSSGPESCVMLRVFNDHGDFGTLLSYASPYETLVNSPAQSSMC